MQPSIACKGNGIQVFRQNKHPDSASGTRGLNAPITAQRANAIADKDESDEYSQSKGPIQLRITPSFVFFTVCVLCSCLPLNKITKHSKAGRSHARLYTHERRLTDSFYFVHNLANIRWLKKKLLLH
jgi:hypothetical protein